MFTKMVAQVKPKQKTEILEEVTIPANVQVEIKADIIQVKGPKGALKKSFSYPNILVQKSDNTIIIKCIASSKKEKAIIGSFVAHLKNMFKGVTEGFKMKLKIVFSHFPITTKVVGNNLEILNFLGEKSPRCAKIHGNVKVSVGKEEIIVEGINIEEVGQIAANIEQATRVRYRDPRIFQDGIYLVSTE